MTIISSAHSLFGLSTDTKPTDVPINRLFFETDTLQQYHFNGAVWEQLPSGGVTGLNPNSTILENSTDIGDYTTPSGTSVTSDANPNIFLQNVGGNPRTLLSGGRTRIGEELQSGNSLLGLRVNQLSFWIRKIGSPTGNASFTIRNSSDAIVETIGTIDVSTLTTSYTKQTLTALGTTVLAEDDKLLVEFTGGSAPNHIEVDTASTDEQANAVKVSYEGGYSNLSGDMRYELTSGGSGSEAIDGDTATFWQSDAGVNESITLDMGSVVNAYGLAYYIDKVQTGITETQFQIQATSVAGFDLTGLEAYYKFNELSGDLLNDATNVGSVDSNAVDFTNSIVTQGVSGGLFDTCYQYGASDAVSVDGATSTNWEFMYGANQIFTAIVWLQQNTATESTDDIVFDNSNSLGGLGVQLSLRGTNGNRLIRFGNHDGTSLELYTTTAGTFPSDTNWHMVMIRVDWGGGADNVEISVDNGTKQLFTSSSTGGNGTSFDEMGFGAIPRTPPVNEVPAKTDEWSFWNRSLTDSEVTSLYNGGLGVEITSDLDVPVLLRTVEVADLTDQAYNFIRFNGANTRFIRIEGSSGGSLIMAANELAVQTESDPPLTTKHGTFEIAGNNPSLPLNGGDPTSSLIEDPMVNNILFNNVVTPNDPELEKAVMWLETTDVDTNSLKVKLQNGGSIQTFELAPGGTGGGITGLNPNSTILEYSTTLEDYTTPTGATATSPPESVPFVQNLSGGSRSLGDGSPVRTKIGFDMTTGFSEVGSTVNTVVFKLYKTGSPTGTINAAIYDSGDTLIETSTNTFDVTTLDTDSAGAKITFVFPNSRTILTGDKFVIEGATFVDNSNTVNMVTNATGSVVANTQVVFFDGSWGVTTVDAYFEIFQAGASLAIDGNTATFWESLAGINESITLDMGSVVNAYGLAYYISTAELASMTETQFQIKVPEIVEGITATGGDSVVQDGNFKIATFTTDGTFEIVTNPNNFTIDVLAIGGGGGGSAGGGAARGGAGGGGAGEHLTSLGVTGTVQTYSVTIGQGGDGGDTAGAGSVAATNSVFDVITSLAGGNGGFDVGGGGVGQSGGSGGGGAGGASGTGGASTGTLGNAGGQAGTGADLTGGGGGGADAAGGIGTNGAAGNGGDGHVSTLDGVQRAAGGGGGTLNGVDTAGLGGAGGGGDSFNNSAAQAATANTGSGGGGGGGTSLVIGGLGGSGVVVVRYFSPTVISVGQLLRTINKSDLVADQYNYIRFNGVNTQILTIEGSSGNSLVMAANELAVQVETDPPLTTLHGQFTINGTDPALTLNGGNPTSSVIDDPAVNSLTLNNTVTQGDPITGAAVLWVETVDADNDGVFARIKVDGTFKTVRVI